MGVKILLDKIPESDTNVLVRSLFGVIKEFYDDPKNQKDYEEWLNINGGKTDG